MTYQVKLSKKNQGTIPVKVLEELGMPKNSSQYVLLVKDIRGGYRLVNQLQEIQKMAGSIEVPKDLQNLSDDELESHIQQAKHDHFSSKP